LPIFIICTVEVGKVQERAGYRRGGQRQVMENGSNSQFVSIIGKRKWGHEWVVGTVSPE
jgi:hypothetical protein